jgi:hypothetical protein
MGSGVAQSLGALVMLDIISLAVDPIRKDRK